MNYSRSDEEDFTTLRVRGELDALSAAELRPLLDEVVRDQRRKVTVDLSELRMVDSSGVGALVSLYKRVKGYGGEVTFSGLTSQPLVIFKLLKLDVVFGLTPEPAPEPALEAPPASIRVVRT